MSKIKQRKELMQKVLEKWNQTDITHYRLSKETGIAAVSLPRYKSGKNLPTLTTVNILYEFFYGKPASVLNNLEMHEIRREIKSIQKRVKMLSERLNVCEEVN
ncbi:hypothetical protein JGH11_19385 [Dysgonomonas sp. Marseille-P4677]|uniref:hypothetical protein n=1 Tax=Dysgonomonas sp. Marseille-P4677 TaxID=2364790 RepID=UPI001912D984|nr:hypothetical protein [Dysgonomonas sp. Marseille-P4677]MBK5723036.1 hypothetical protein [Dysgonomonas sp. Marseille-P4677]